MVLKHTMEVTVPGVRMSIFIINQIDNRQAIRDPKAESIFLMKYEKM